MTDPNTSPNGVVSSAELGDAKCDCEVCCGKGWNWEGHRVAERKSDVQTFKIQCATSAKEQAMNWVKQIFCSHRFEFVRNIYGDEIIERGWKRSIWLCSICDKKEDRDELHKP